MPIRAPSVALNSGTGTMSEKTSDSQRDVLAEINKLIYAVGDLAEFEKADEQVLIGACLGIVFNYIASLDAVGNDRNKQLSEAITLVRLFHDSFRSAGEDEPVPGIHTSN